jgi:hypothetical protein
VPRLLQQNKGYLSIETAAANITLTDALGEVITSSAKAYCKCRVSIGKQLAGEHTSPSLFLPPS